MPPPWRAPKREAKRWSRTTPRMRLRSEEIARIRVAEKMAFLDMGLLCF